MSGYREFAVGEVLTSSNVNDFLMRQSVMKFADSAARDTALGTAVGGSNALREGMVAYLENTDEVQFFDGSSWGPVAPDVTSLDASVITSGTLSYERLPLKLATGQYSVVAGNSGSTTTFPSGRFSSTPKAIGIVQGTTDGAVPTSVRSISSTSVTFVHGSGITRTVAWIAIQE